MNLHTKGERLFSFFKHRFYFHGFVFSQNRKRYFISDFPFLNNIGEVVFIMKFFPVYLKDDIVYFNPSFIGRGMGDDGMTSGYVILYDKRSVINGKFILFFECFVKHYVAQPYKWLYYSSIFFQIA